MLEKDGIYLLNQLIDSLEKALLKLEDAYENKEYENFNKIKKFIINIQNKISKAIK